MRGVQSSGPPGQIRAIDRWQHSSWFISSRVIEKKHLRTGSSSCCSNAWMVARATTAGPDASKFASTANQYMSPRRCSGVKPSGRSSSHGRSAGFHTVRLDFS
ncbi:hypothetical protein [Actinomadura physcomitrii]|uniref:hypothetical protein n=1 Tax=Actinomadura physcomitrii TaxID=2650748 RepID=UPI001F376ED3|nr:hypothetical protein [Actinomadura physcomitrii]